MPIIVSIIIAVLALAAMVVLAFRLSPWPSVLIIRATGVDGMDAAEKVAPLVPPEVMQHLDLRYGDGRDERFDLFLPSDDTRQRATIVWVHGGAFIAGIKEALRPYLALLASHGFTVIGVEYTKAPEGRYPTPLRQLARALDHLHDHAAELGVDPTRILLAGDSAGAHIAAQAALAMSDPVYAQSADIPVTRCPHPLRGVVLASGPYDLGFDMTRSPFARFLRTVLWAYTGTKRFAEDPRFGYASLVEHVSNDYPPAFITTGPADPLLPQSIRLAERLRAAGATVETLFFDAATTDEAIGHEYQLQLDTVEGRDALQRIVAFARAHAAAWPESPRA